MKGKMKKKMKKKFDIFLLISVSIISSIGMFIILILYLYRDKMLPDFFMQLMDNLIHRVKL